LVDVVLKQLVNVKFKSKLNLKEIVFICLSFVFLKCPQRISYFRRNNVST